MMPDLNQVVDEDGDVWGEEAVVPPEPPPEPGRRRALPPEPPPDELLRLGPPPDDAIAQAAWMRRALLAQAYIVMRDARLSQDQRSKEIRSLFSDAAKHFTDAARYDVKQLIDQHRRIVEERKRAKASAKTERRPAPGGAKVIPIRRDG